MPGGIEAMKPRQEDGSGDGGPQGGSSPEAGAGDAAPPEAREGDSTAVAHAGKLGAPPTLIFAGFAKLPANAGVPYGGGVLAIEIEVDPYDMRVVDAACQCLPALGEKFLTGLLVGAKLEEGLERAASEIRSRYFSITQRSMIAALQDVQRRYEEFRKGEGGTRGPEGVPGRRKG